MSRKATYCRKCELPKVICACAEAREYDRQPYPPGWLEGTSATLTTPQDK